MPHKFKKSILHVLIMTVISSHPLFSQYQYTTPETLDDSWQTTDIRIFAKDTTRLYKMMNQLNQVDHKLHSMLLIKDNQLLLEEYFSDYDLHQQHDLRSASKSITSILLGIAIDKGYIDNINDPITKYLKEPVPQKNKSLEKDQITIKHLVTMSSGLDCNDWDKSSLGQEDKVYKKKDWLQYFVDLPMVNTPGDIAQYCTMGQILATEIISQTSGMSIDEFCSQFLFEPMEITNVSWGHTSNKNVIPSAKRLYMTPRDMAKIGQLILDKGKWEGNQLVSENWVNQSTSPHVKITGVDYGFLWWSIPVKIDFEIYQCIAATGNGGQYIMTFPALDVVAVFTGGAYNSQDDKLPFKIIQDVLLPAIK